MDESSSIISGLVVKIVSHELNDMLCDDSTGCEETDDDDYFYHRSRHNDRCFI